MVREREKAMRHRMPLESNHLTLSDVKYPGRERLELYPPKQEITFNLEDSPPPDNTRYYHQYLTSQHQLSLEQLKALQLSHDEMRQRCERVIGTYDYEQHL